MLVDRLSSRAGGISSSFRIFQFVVIFTVKDFNVVNEAEVDIFSGIILLFL